jgi:magnesium chelatase subunit I
MIKSEAKTLGELKKTNYKSRSIKEELRNNLIIALRENENVFEGIQGYDDTVILSIRFRDREKI